MKQVYIYYKDGSKEHFDCTYSNVKKGCYWFYYNDYLLAIIPKENIKKVEFA